MIAKVHIPNFKTNLSCLRDIADQHTGHLTISFDDTTDIVTLDFNNTWAFSNYPAVLKCVEHFESIASTKKHTTNSGN